MVKRLRRLVWPLLIVVCLFAVVIGSVYALGADGRQDSPAFINPVVTVEGVGVSPDGWTSHETAQWQNDPYCATYSICGSTAKIGREVAGEYIATSFVASGSGSLTFDTAYISDFGSGSLAIVVYYEGGHTTYTVERAEIGGKMIKESVTIPYSFAAGEYYHVVWTTLSTSAWIIANINGPGSGSYPAAQSGLTHTFDSDVGSWAGDAVHDSAWGHGGLGALSFPRDGYVLLNSAIESSGLAFWGVGSDPPDGEPNTVEVLVNDSVVFSELLPADRWAYYVIEEPLTSTDSIKIQLQGTTSGAKMYLDDVTFIGAADPNADGDWAGLCSFVTTTTVTDTEGVTTTETITYTRPANLVPNPSFEESDNGYSPNGWETVVAGSQQYAPPFYQVSESLARTGSASVFDGWEFELHNPLPLFASGSYEVGYYARCIGSPCPTDGAVTSLWGLASLATSQSLTSTYQVFTDTISSGGGSQRLVIRFNEGSGTVAVDDVYVIPVDEAGALDCSPEYYEPYDPDEDSPDALIGIGSTPLPTGGAGSTCYYCTSPNSLYETSVSYWIAWLGCVIRNMFSCSLRVWLLRVSNWTAGVVQILLAFLTWIPQTAQSGANWILSTVVTAIPGSVVVTTGTNMFDVLIAIIDLIRSLIVVLSSLMLGVIGKVIGFATAVTGAFQVEPYEFELGTTAAGIDGSFNLDSGLATAGPNTDKMMWLFLTVLGLIDQRVIGGNAEIFSIAVGAVSLLIIIWTVTWWKDIVQF